MHVHCSVLHTNTHRHTHTLTNTQERGTSTRHHNSANVSLTYFTGQRVQEQLLKSMCWNSKGCSLFLHSHWSKPEVCTYRTHTRTNERTHTYNHIHTGNMQIPGGGIRGQDMLWSITLCICEMCINTLMGDRKYVVFKHSLCYLLWWTSWLQRAGVSEMDFLCVCVRVCVCSLLLQWWSQKPVCVFISLLPVVACNVIDPEGVADVLLAFVLVLAEAWQDVDLIELGVDGGSLGKARHRYCGGKK